MIRVLALYHEGRRRTVARLSVLLHVLLVIEAIVKALILSGIILQEEGKGILFLLVHVLSFHQ